MPTKTGRKNPEKPILIKCESCNKEFYRRKSRLKDNNYCSISCRGKGRALAMTRQIEVACYTCGAITLKKPSVIGEHTFCGRACYSEWRKSGAIQELQIEKGNSVLINCLTCNKQFYRKKSHAERTPNSFCSRECQGQWQSLARSKENHPLWDENKQLHLECTECGKAIHRNVSEMSKSKHPFCSLQCAGKWRSKNLVGENNPRWQGGGVSLNCPECGTEFREIRALANVGRRFCSMDCKNRFHSKEMFKDGGARYYGPNWYAQRRTARDRDNHTCQMCGKTREEEGRNMPVHHIKRFADFGYDPFTNDNYLEANQLSNLVTLCSRCHGRLERGAITYP